jgi:ring-1,2-phenylacetyl-CoA epoxidase subunit PaaC
MTASLFDHVLGLADDALILGHRLSEWCGHAPLLEEELALANIGLDLIGQARALYDHAGAIEGKGRDQDALAYRRDATGFRNLLLVEQPNGDFAITIARQFLYSAYAAPFWRSTAGSDDPTLAGIARSARHETAYHLRHAGDWLIRLGDGTAESRRRVEAALDALWPYTGEMFAGGNAALRPEWDRTVDDVLAGATLTRPKAGWMQSGGRSGRHSEHLGYILAELQFLQRAYPGAQW